MKLSTLFDYQKFVNDPELQDVIDSVEKKYSMTEIPDEDLEYLSAAGDITSNVKKPEDGG